MNTRERIAITDVSPRDGLQNQTVAVSTADKLALIRHLAAAGVRSIEATSFVSPKAVPQMADAADVIASARGQPDVRISALVPNLRGLERALEAGVTEVAVVVSATETMNLRNINLSLEQAIRTGAETLRGARRSGLATRAYVAVAVECPFEGPTPIERVVSIAAGMLEAGAGEVVVADTIGAAAPAQIDRLLAALAPAVPIDSTAIHLHDTRGLACANAWAALQRGVRRFDASVGGIGGCPFAPGAAGNLATEDLVLMAEQSGFDTGIDYAALAEVVDFAQAILGQSLGGRSMPWYRRRRSGRR